MISFQNNGSRLCDGITRREFLRVGGLTALGLTLADFLRTQAAHAQQENPKSEIKSRFLHIAVVDGRSITH